MGVSRWKEAPVWESETPWSESQIIESTFRGLQETRNAIESLPGGLLHSSLSDVQSSVSLFLNSVEDFRKSISEFQGNALRPGFWDRPNDTPREKLETTIQRGLFCSSMAALALVDHTRRFVRSYPIDGYEDRKNREFANNREHAFVHHLRQYATHFRATKANWRITRNAQGDSVHFLLYPNELKQWPKWSNLALEYIESHADAIDVEALFDSYSVTVTHFHEWLRARVWENHHDRLAEYYRAHRIHKGASSRSWWNILVQQVARPKGLDPYEYLGRYLTQSQIEEVMALPYRSREQVNRIIYYIDEFGACDDGLRKKLYELFGVSR